ncbi:MAG TPA: thioredoxin domain-containing protein [Thermoanaerobaculia bacterium]|jgi:protein-disulfide isomerase|nr:thioredoxin domain-containing protein [Thermoanaerobaculia bacterium]
MKTLLTLFAAAIAAPSLLAQSLSSAALIRYAEHAFPQCPAQVFKIEPITQPGPAGFDVYRVSEASSDESCGSQKYLLVSPKSHQTILGTVIRLPEDTRPVHIRIAEHATNMLKSPMSARVAPLALPDGLKAVSITRDTPFGHFAYDGYIDASEGFLLIGMRGNLSETPEKTLRDALAAGAAARRGNAKAKTEIIELSDLECPSCGRAHKQLEPLIAKNLSKVNYARFDLPLFEHHEWSFQAAMGARAIQRVAPARYWEYVNTVFANQEVLTKDTIDAFVKNFCTDRDINWAAIEKIYSSASERQALLDQVSRAFALGIVSTPTYIINGRTMGFGPEGEFTINAVRKAIGLPPVKVAKKK